MQKKGEERQWKQVSFKSVYNWIKQKREKGSLKPNKPSSTRRRKINKEDLKKYVQEHPDHYLREIAVVFNVSSGAIFKALKNMQITLKKTLLYKEREEKRRKEFQEKIKSIAKDRLVFIDESGIDIFLSRKLGRSLRGDKIYGETSGRRYARQSFIAAKVGSRIIAPMIFEGICHSKLFETWIEEFLTKELIPGQIVIINNTAFHKSAKTSPNISC